MTIYAPLFFAAAGQAAGIQQLLACSVCYGDPNSAMSKGLTMGVLFLAAVIGLVLAAFACFFITLKRRAADCRSNSEASESADCSRTAQ